MILAAHKMRGTYHKSDIRPGLADTAMTSLRMHVPSIEWMDGLL